MNAKLPLAVKALIAMSVDIIPLLKLLSVVIASSLLTEVLLWLWAFRSPAFQSLKVQLERQSKKLESMKSNGSSANKKHKKADRLESHLKDTASTQMASIRFKQAAVMGVSLFIIFRFLNKRYDGVNLAKLPFEPPSLIRKLSQRNLKSPAVDDCAFAFMYAILNVSIRPNIGKLLNLGPSRKMLDMAAFAPPQYQQ